MKIGKTLEKAQALQTRYPTRGNTKKAPTLKQSSKDVANTSILASKKAYLPVNSQMEPPMSLADFKKTKPSSFMIKLFCDNRTKPYADFLLFLYTF